jgi:hypothetical protein
VTYFAASRPSIGSVKGNLQKQSNTLQDESCVVPYTEQAGGHGNFWRNLLIFANSMMCLCESRPMEGLAENPVHCNIKKKRPTDWSNQAQDGASGVALRPSLCITIKKCVKDCQSADKQKRAGTIHGAFSKRYVDKYQPRSARMRLTRRETLREAVFLWKTPFCAPRMSSGSATFIAVSAACLFPVLIASSTLRRELRTRLTRFLFTVARRAETRVAFFADFVLAI